MATVDALSQAVMTRTISLIPSLPRFLRDTFFPSGTTLPHETIEMGEIRDQNLIAPMTLVSSNAYLVPGVTDNIRNVGLPNSAIERPFSAELLGQTRHAGDRVFVDTGAQMGRQILRLIGRDIEKMTRMHDALEEWMCAQALFQGRLVYNEKYGRGEESFVAEMIQTHVGPVNAPLGITGTIVPTTLWSDAQADPRVAFEFAKITQNRFGIGTSDAIFANDAWEAFIALDGIEAAINRESAFVNQGRLDYAANYRDSGAIFRGRFFGVDLWSYNRQVVVDEEGTVEDLVPEHTVTFIGSGPTTRKDFYYGAMRDFHMARNGVFVGKRYSTSYRENKPGKPLMAYARTRPLPLLRDPLSVIQFEVL
jgi:hypothetical protein